MNTYSFLGNQKMDEKNRVVYAYLFPNDMVMAFNADGKQVPDYQGHKDEALPLIKRDFPEVEIRKGGLRI
jgi:hypothetical protein